MAIKPGKYNPLKPDIELFDFKSKKRYGLKLEGSGALQVGTISQDDSVHIRSAGKRVGDFDEQRSWKGGRGHDKLSENPEGYWDSRDAWTLSEGRVHQSLLWQFAKGLRNSEFFMPSKTHSLTWKPLLGTQRFISNSWITSGMTSDYARAWIRRVGSPSTLVMRLYADSGGNPGTLLQSVSVTAASVADVVSVLQKFDWSGTQGLSSSARYHISLGSQSTDTKNNHWEVGVYQGGGTGKMSSDGSSWSLAGFDLFYYICDADQRRTFYSFFHDDAMYVVDQQDNGGNSRLFINGDRGKATAVSSNTLTDSTKSWATNQWAGAMVRIIRGTGKGQTRLIASNTGTVITFSLSGVEWALTPDTTSEYIIYSTERFTEITGHGLGRVTSAPLVVNQIVYFPLGDSANMIRMIWSGSAHVFSSDSNPASFLAKTMDANGTRIWRGLNNTGLWQPTTLSYATAAAGANPPANLTFSAVKGVGDSNSYITNLAEKDGTVYIFKEDGLWTTNNSFILTQIITGLEKTPSRTNGYAVLAHGNFLYYSWLHSVIRVYGSSHDDVGQDWSGYGLPDGREGNFSSLDSYTSLLIAGVDAGTTGTSSVLAFDGIGWHEILRGYDTNKRIRMVKLQPCQDTRNRLWTEIGGDLIYQEMPLGKGSPRLDTGVRYMHEAVIESSAIDMGTASGLPKFIKELTVFCENLGEGNEIYVDYQVDEDVHTSRWTHASVMHESPESTVFLGLNNVRMFAYRLRVCSSDNTSPVHIQGVVPNGYARSPYKMVWTLRCKADNITSRGRLVKPDVLMRWLLDNARYPGRIEMQSQYELAHKFFVIIHPPRMFPYKPGQNGQAEESVFTIVLEEI